MTMLGLSMLLEKLSKSSDLGEMNVQNFLKCIRPCINSKWIPAGEKISKL